MASNRTVFVTRQDFERLTELLETHVSRRDKPALTALQEKLGRAVVVESSKIPDVVTMTKARSRCLRPLAVRCWALRRPVDWLAAPWCEDSESLRGERHRPTGSSR